jgi:hypothetical protein
MAGITTYLSLLTLNVNRLNSLTKNTVWQTGLERKIPQSVVSRRPTSLTETNSILGLKARRFFKLMAPKNRQE